MPPSFDTCASISFQVPSRAYGYCVVPGGESAVKARLPIPCSQITVELSGAVYLLLAFGARLPDPFTTCASAGSHLLRLSVPRFCSYSFCSQPLDVMLCIYVNNIMTGGSSRVAVEDWEDPPPAPP